MKKLLSLLLMIGTFGVSFAQKSSSLSQVRCYYDNSFDDSERESFIALSGTFSSSDNANVVRPVTGSIGLLYQNNLSRYYVGGSYQLSGQRLSMYSPKGTFNKTLDIGYGRLISGIITLDAVVSLGQQSSFIRPTKDGHFRSVGSKVVSGAGLDIGVNLGTFNIFAGYNSLKGVGFGLRVKILNLEKSL